MGKLVRRPDLDESHTTAALRTCHHPPALVAAAATIIDAALRAGAALVGSLAALAAGSSTRLAKDVDLNAPQNVYNKTVEAINNAAGATGGALTSTSKSVLWTNVGNPAPPVGGSMTGRSTTFIVSVGGASLTIEVTERRFCWTASQLVSSYFGTHFGVYFYFNESHGRIIGCRTRAAERATAAGSSS